jgi:hypothetical protein
MGNQLSRKKALYLILAMQCMSQTRKAITKYICSNMFPLHVGWQTADNRRMRAAPHCCRRAALLFRRLCAAAAETKILPIGHLASLESLSSYYSLYHHIL